MSTNTETPAEQDDFADIEHMQTQSAARRITSEPLDPETVNNKKTGRTVGTAVAIGGLVAAATALAVTGHEATREPDIAQKTFEHTILPGETLYNILDDVPGINTVNRQDLIDTIEHLPANHDIDFNKLMPGDTISIPVTVGDLSQSETNTEE